MTTADIASSPSVAAATCSMSMVSPGVMSVSSSSGGSSGLSDGSSSVVQLAAAAAAAASHGPAVAAAAAAAWSVREAGVGADPWQQYPLSLPLQSCLI